MWVNLNVQVLQEGIDGFLKALRKLPRHVRSLPVAYHLETKMKSFKEAIPLLLDLKNEALRERCDFRTRACTSDDIRKPPESSISDLYFPCKTWGGAGGGGFQRKTNGLGSVTLPLPMALL